MPFSELTGADVDAFMGTAHEDPEGAHELAVRALTRLNPQLALRIASLVALAQEQHDPAAGALDIYTLAGILCIHAQNQDLESQI